MSSQETSATSRLNEKTPSTPSNKIVGDIVIEFKENNRDRWLLPRDNLVCERPSSTSYHYTNELTLSFTLNSANTGPSSANKEESSANIHPVACHLSKVSYSLWRIISILAGSSFQPTDARAELQKIVRILTSIYLS